MVPLMFLNVTVKPALEMLHSSTKSPVAMSNGEMPLDGTAPFHPPRLLVPVKNALVNVTALADVPLAIVAVLCSVRCCSCAL